MNPSTRIIIITGGSAGIGRALAVGLADSGATVHVVARSAAGLEETRKLVAHAGHLHAHVGDVSDPVFLEGLFQDIVARHGRVDLLVNNAAVYPRWQLGESPPDAWGAAAAINLNGVANGCRAAIRTFPRDQAALVLNVGTFAYLNPSSGDSLYCATKAGVSALTQALGVELSTAGSKLIVNEWIPGIYRTEMSGWTGDDPQLALGRLLAVWDLSMTGRGGRRFERDIEVLPPTSRRERLKRRLARILGKG